jgi:uncharacterized protein (TIGR02246 family)
MAAAQDEAPRLFQTQASADCTGIEDIVATLERAFNIRHADLWDSVLAADVAWGSPKGQVVLGSRQLNAIHRRLHQARGTAGQFSRYAIEHVGFLGEDVACAHVRRIGTDEHDIPLDPGVTNEIVQEMALYVLVHRNGRWWIAAGQNTPTWKEHSKLVR